MFWTTLLGVLLFPLATIGLTVKFIGIVLGIALMLCGAWNVYQYLEDYICPLITFEDENEEE